MEKWCYLHDLCALGKRFHNVSQIIELPMVKQPVDAVYQFQIVLTAIWLAEIPTCSWTAFIASVHSTCELWDPLKWPHCNKRCGSAERFVCFKRGSKHCDLLDGGIRISWENKVVYFGSGSWSCVDRANYDVIHGSATMLICLSTLQSKIIVFQLVCTIQDLNFRWGCHGQWKGRKLLISLFG